MVMDSFAVLAGLGSELSGNMLYQLIIFAISIFIISKASHVVIDNAVRISKITKLGELVMGFIVLSIATSLPEITVSLSAIMTGDSGISVGTLLGANISDLGLVLGISAIMMPIVIRKHSFKKLPLLLFLCSIIPISFLVMNQINTYVGLVLIGVFVFFLIYSTKKKINIGISKTMPRDIFKKIIMPASLYKYSFFLSLAMLVVILSSNFVVSSASNISSIMGISDSVIGATVIAICSSLPELCVSLTAVKTNHSKMAIGNIIGACLIRLTLIFGIVLIISPVAIDMSLFSTILMFMIGITVMTWYFLHTGRRIDRREGIVLLLTYMLFIIAAFSVQIAII